MKDSTTTHIKTITNTYTKTFTSSLSSHSSTVIGQRIDPVDIDNDPAGTLYLYGMLIYFNSRPTKPFMSDSSVKPDAPGYKYYKALAYKGIPNVRYVLYNAGDKNILPNSCDILKEAYDEAAASDYLDHPEHYYTDDWDADYAIDTWCEREHIRQQLVWHWSDYDQEVAVSLMEKHVTHTVVDDIVQNTTYTINTVDADELPTYQRVDMDSKLALLGNKSVHLVVSLDSETIASNSSNSEWESETTTTVLPDDEYVCSGIKENAVDAEDTIAYKQSTDNVHKDVTTITNNIIYNILTFTEIDILFIIIIILLVCLSFSIYNLLINI